MIAPVDQTPAAEGDSPSRQAFQGFEPITANFLYCPNQFFDVCLPNCSRGVVRIVAYVLRQTLGWVDEHGDPINEDVTVSYDDLIQKAGVSNGAIGDAIDDAVALGFLRCTQEPKAHAHNQPARNGTYELCWDRTSKYVTDLKSFRGFYASGGNFTTIPNQFFDEILTSEPLSTVKVVGSVIRHTVGYETRTGQRKQVAALSHSFLANYAKISMGRRLNGAIQSALVKRYIQRTTQGVYDSRGREFGKTSEYAIKWRQKDTSIQSSPKRPVKQSRGNHSKKASEIAPKRPVKKLSKKASNGNTSVNDNNKEQVVAVEFQEAFDLLTQVEFDGKRFDGKTCLKLAQSGGLDEIKQQIQWLPYRKANRNPLGMLRSAIEQDWSAPIEIIERNRNRDAAHKEQEAVDAESAEVAEIDRVKKEIRQHRKDVLPRWNRLTDKERNGIEQSASEQLNSDFHRKQFQTNDDFHLEKCLDELCRQKGTIPIISLVR